MSNVAKHCYDYWIRVFGLKNLLAKIDDPRKSCDYSLPEIVLKIIAGICTHVRSFNHLESRVLNGYLDGIGGTGRPTADCYRRTVMNIPVQQLENVIDEITRKARYNRALDQTRVCGYRVVAVDGTGLFSTYSARLGKHSHFRKNVHGEEITQPIYLEHALAVSYVSANGPNLLLDLVRIPKGEGETTTARKTMASLYERICRYCDIVTVDSLYAQAPFINEVLRQGKDVVVRVKNENYNIIKDADGLFAKLSPHYTRRNVKLSQNSRTIYDVELWDAENFTSWEQVNKPLRCIKVRETRRTLNAAGKEIKREQIETHLVTSCLQSSVPATTIWEIAHRRWDIENNGFHFLKNHFQLEHAYVYDPVGIEVMLKLFVIAFNLFQLFWHRNLSCRRLHKSDTMLSFMDRLLIGFANLADSLHRKSASGMV